MSEFVGDNISGKYIVNSIMYEFAIPLIVLYILSMILIWLSDTKTLLDLIIPLMVISSKCSIV